MPRIKKTRTRAPQWSANDAKVVNWAVQNGIITKTAGEKIINSKSWTVKIHEGSKKPRSYYSRVRDKILARKGGGEDLPSYIDTFAQKRVPALAIEEVEASMQTRQMGGAYASAGSVAEDIERARQKRKAMAAAEEVTRRVAQRTGRAAVEQAEKSMEERHLAGAYASAGAVAEDLGMDKPEDILNVNTEGTSPMKPIVDINTQDQKLNRGDAASADQVADGQLDGARQRAAMDDIDKALNAKRKRVDIDDEDLKRLKREPTTGIKRAADDDPNLRDPKSVRLDDQPPPLPSTPSPSLPPLEPMPPASTPPGTRADPVIKQEEDRAKSLQAELDRLEQELKRQDEKMAENRRREQEAKTQAEKERKHRENEALLARVKEAEEKRKQREEELKRIEEDLRMRYERIGQIKRDDEGKHDIKPEELPDAPPTLPTTPPPTQQPPAQQPPAQQCPTGTQPAAPSTVTPDIPGIAERPAADPNATTVQPGTLGYQQPQGIRATPRFAEDIARTAKGDIIRDIQSHEPYEPDLRPEYGMEKAGQVIPATRKQLESDIRFDMFDHVKPGFGEGMDNKLFLMQEARDKKIVYAPDLHAPGQWIGPTAGVDVPPWQWQRVIPSDVIRNYQQETRSREHAGTQLLLSTGPRSSNILGDDIGYPMPYSACELKRNPYSPFEPVIRTDMHWQHVKEPIGVKLNRKRMRLETDAQRYPRALDSSVVGQGGVNLPKRRSLEVILP